MFFAPVSQGSEPAAEEISQPTVENAADPNRSTASIAKWLGAFGVMFLLMRTLRRA